MSIPTEFLANSVVRMVKGTNTLETEIAVGLALLTLMRFELPDSLIYLLIDNYCGQYWSGISENKPPFLIHKTLFALALDFQNPQASRQSQGGILNEKYIQRLEKHLGIPFENQPYFADGFLRWLKRQPPTAATAVLEFGRDYAEEPLPIRLSYYAKVNEHPFQGGVLTLDKPDSIKFKTGQKWCDSLLRISGRRR